MDNNENTTKDILIAQVLEAAWSGMHGPLIRTLDSVLNECVETAKQEASTTYLYAYNKALDDVLRVASLSPDQAQSIHKLKSAVDKVKNGQ